jgi:hypothetical protein
VPVRRAYILLILFVCASSIQCDQPSCSPGEEQAADETSDQEHWTRRSAAVGVAPVSARAVVVSSSLNSLLPSTEIAVESLPLASPSRLVGKWEGMFGWKAWDPGGWKVWGVDTGAPAALFYDRGWWAASMTIEDPERFEKVREDWVSNEEISAQAADTEEFEGVNLELGRERLHIASDGEVLLVAIKVTESPSDAAAGSGFPGAWLPDETSFVDRLRYKDLLVDALDFGEPAGIVRPATWMSAHDSTGQAAVLYERIAAQLGPVAFAMAAEPAERRVHLRILTPGEKGAPRAMTDLGRAEGELPPVGGLIEPGVLGVVRVSASPQSLYQLFLSGLPAEQRTEFQGFWRRLDEELKIDARTNVLQNLQGHAVVAVYGIKTEALEAAGDDWINSVVRLQATREAALLPIKDREKMLRVLDALTTVTKNKLKRQAVGETIQYAYFSDGELEWAFILGDNHVLYVDSAVAFDQAMAYEEAAHPLGESMADAEVDKLIEPSQVSGFYVDAENLGNLLTEAENTDGARLLAPLRRVLMTTSMQDGVGVTDLRLQLAPPTAAPGERVQPSRDEAPPTDTPSETDAPDAAGQ